MGNVADEAAQIRELLEAQQAAGDLAAVLAELRLLNRRLWGVDAAGNALAPGLTPLANAFSAPLPDGATTKTIAELISGGLYAQTKDLDSTLINMGLGYYLQRHIGPLDFSFGLIGTRLNQIAQQLQTTYEELRGVNGVSRQGDNLDKLRLIALALEDNDP